MKRQRVVRMRKFLQTPRQQGHPKDWGMTLSLSLHLLFLPLLSSCTIKGNHTKLNCLKTRNCCFLSQISPLNWSTVQPRALWTKCKDNTTAFFSIWRAHQTAAWWNNGKSHSEAQTRKLHFNFGKTKIRQWVSDANAPSQISPLDLQEKRGKTSSTKGSLTSPNTKSGQAKSCPIAQH